MIPATVEVAIRCPGVALTGHEETLTNVCSNNRLHRVGLQMGVTRIGPVGMLNDEHVAEICAWTVIRIEIRTICVKFVADL